MTRIHPSSTKESSTLASYGPPNEWKEEVDRADRLEALRALRLLDTPAECSFDRLTRMAAQILGAPVALVSLVDDHRQFFKSIHGLPEPWASRRQTPLTHSFCKHVVATKEPLIVEDARENTIVCDNLAVSELNVLAYLGYPLVTSDGQVIGSFCVIDTVPRNWTAQDRSVVNDLTALVMTEIELRQDVARLRDLEGELRAARKLAEEGSQAKGDFLAHMSHEVRTPLAAMIGFTEMLLDPNVGGEERLNAIEAIRRNGMHLQEIVDDILDLAKLESGKLELEAIPSDPCTLLRDVVETLRSRAEASGLTIEVKCIGTLPGKAELDATKVRQILFNLGGNAVKFTKAGSIRFTLEQEPADRGRYWLRFSVEDTGIGMSQKQLSCLFTPFYQADPSMKRKYGGTGLGLSISQKLARAMGGELTAESHLGAGSRFCFRVPVRVLTPAEQDSAIGLSSPPQVEPLARFSGTVLLADDSEDIRRAMIHRLRRLGVAVESAPDGEAAISMAMSRKYNLILMDMQMPKVDGITAVRTLRASGYSGPIVALTANAFEEDQRRCLEAGCSGHMRKPVKLEDLTRELRASCPPVETVVCAP